MKLYGVQAPPRATWGKLRPRAMKKPPSVQAPITSQARAPPCHGLSSRSVRWDLYAMSV